MASPQRENKIQDLLQEVYAAGFEDGYVEGYSQCAKDCKNNYKAAVSSGLRLGSSECGSAMNSFKEGDSCLLHS